MTNEHIDAIKREASIYLFAKWFSSLCKDVVHFIK